MGVNPDSIPRYEEPRYPDAEPTCSGCHYFKDVERHKNGLSECIGVCIYETYKAKTLEKLELAQVYYMEPDWSACKDYKEAEEAW